MPWISLLFGKTWMTGRKGQAGDEGTFFLSLTHSDSVKAFKHFFPGPEKEKAAAHAGCYLGVC